MGAFLTRKAPSQGRSRDLDSGDRPPALRVHGAEDGGGAWAPGGRQLLRTVPGGRDARPGPTGQRSGPRALAAREAARLPVHSGGGGAAGPRSAPAGPCSRYRASTCLRFSLARLMATWKSLQKRRTAGGESSLPGTG